MASEETSALQIAQIQIHALEKRLWALPTAFERPECLLDAQDDFSALHEFLVTRCQKPSTHKAMTSAIRKLLVFMRLRRLNGLHTIKLRHCSEFQKWLQNPEPDIVFHSGRPPTYWLSRENRPNPDWRPFKGPMNAVTAQQTVNRLSTMFQFMCDAGYLTGNPWKLAQAITKDTRIGQHGDASHSDRELPFSCIEVIRHYLHFGEGFEDEAAGLGPDHPVLPRLEARVFARRRWIFYFYFYTAARVSSGCFATLDDIYLDSRENAMLSLIVKGQGVKRHSVPWVSDLQDEYYRYRSAMGLPAMAVKPHTSVPKPRDKRANGAGPRHLILRLGAGDSTKDSEPMSYDAIYREIKELFEYVHRWALRHPELGLTDRELAILERASGHWVRHGTAALMGSYAKEQLGHRYESTTQSYQVAKRQAQIARLQSIGELAVEDDALLGLLEAPEEERIRWWAKLAESYIAAGTALAENRKQELLSRLMNLPTQ